MNVKQSAIFVVLSIALINSLHAIERQPKNPLREYLVKITSKTPLNIYELIQLMIFLHKLNPEDITDTEMLSKVVAGFDTAQTTLNKLQEEKDPLARLILDKFSLEQPRDLQRKLSKFELLAALHLRKLRLETQKAIEEKEVVRSRPPKKAGRAEKPGVGSALEQLIKQKLTERRRAVAESSEDESE